MMKTRKTTRLIGLFLSILMLVTLLGAFSLTSSAAEAVSYVERAWDSENKVVTSATKSVTDYTVITNQTTWGTADTVSWYVLNSDVTFTDSISVRGDVNLILADGATLMLDEEYIELEDGATLTIYGQANDTGAIEITPPTATAYPAIGAPHTGTPKAITIHGGTISAQAEPAGIGSGHAPISITIYGGTVTAEAKSTNPYAGIATAGSGSINIYGGNVTGTAARGIGIGVLDPNGGTVNIYGGTVHGESAKGPGIGLYKTPAVADYGNGTVNIFGGTVTASGNGTNDVGIGAGYGASCTVNISGGTVTALGNSEDGVGIGGSWITPEIVVNISGGTVTAISPNGPNAIGGGYKGTNVNVTISGGSVKAAKIGAGYPVEASTVFSLTDGNGNDVSLVEVTIAGMETSADVTALGGVSGYGLNDVSTQDTNKLYLYMTADQASAMNSITAGGEVYEGGVSEGVGTFGVLYTVVFDKNGGAGTMDDETGIIDPNYTLPACTFTAPDGKAFQAWLVGETEYDPGEIAVLTTETTTIKAVWKNTYSVSFDANGGEGTMDDETGIIDPNYTLPACDFTPPTDMMFAGWEFGGEAYHVGETVTLAKDTENTLKALWTNQKFTVSFAANGGEGEMATVENIVENDYYTLPQNGFTAPANKQFDKWRVVIGEGDAQLMQPGEKIIVTANVTLTALWTDLYTVSYSGGGADGTMDPVLNLTRGYVHTLPENGFTVPQNKRFGGWLMIGGASDSETKQPGDQITVTGDVTVRAVWVDIYYVTLTPGEGTGDNIVEDPVDLGDSYLVPACPVEFAAPENMVFKGWNTQADGSGRSYAPGDTIYPVDADITLTAQWREPYGFAAPPVAIPTLTFTNEWQTLITAGVLDQAAKDAGGVIEYRIDSTWSEELPEGLTAETYTVFYRIVVDGVAYAEGEFDVTIAKKPINVTLGGLLDWYQWKEGDPELKPAVTVQSTDPADIFDEESYEITYSKTTDFVEGVAVTVTVTSKSTANYVFEASESYMVSVEHSHVWAFAAEDADGDGTNDTLVATCVGHCSPDTSCDVGEVNITLVLPEDLIYNNRQKPVTVNINTADGRLPNYDDNFDVVYSTGVIPENCGEVTATLTVDGATISVTYTIIPLLITKDNVTVDPFEDMTYNFQTQTPVANVYVGNILVTGTWSNVENVNDLTSFVANGNFEGTIEGYQTGMNKLSVQVPEIDSKVYDGNHQIADLPPEMPYTVIENEGGINAGSYQVVLQLENTENLVWETTDEETVTLTFVIEKIVLDETFESEYTGEAQLPEILTGAPYILISKDGFTDVGEYVVVLELVETDNYEWKAPDAENGKLTNAIFTITQATNEWITLPTVKDWRLGDVPSTPRFEAKFGEVSVWYMPAGGTPEDVTDEPPTEMGTYVATFAVDMTDQYSGLLFETTFEIDLPRVTIGGWGLPALHYMDTNGIISQTQPEGGYAYMRADNTLLLSNFELYASVFAEIDASEDPELLEKLAEYRHLYLGGFSAADENSSLITLYADTTVLLLGENLLLDIGSAMVIMAHDSALTLRGGTLYAQGPIVADERLTVEGSLVETGAIISLNGNLTILYSKVGALIGIATTQNMIVTDSFLQTDMIRSGSYLMLENSTVITSNLMVFTDSESESRVAGNVTVLNSTLKLTGLTSRAINLYNSFVAKNSKLYFDNCEVGILAYDLTLTDCELKATVPTTEATNPFLYAKSLTVNGGSILIENAYVGIYSSDLSVTNAEIEIVFLSDGIFSNGIFNIKDSRLTLTGAEETSMFGIAVEGSSPEFGTGVLLMENSTLQVENATFGIFSNSGGLVGLYNSTVITENVSGGISLQDGVLYASNSKLTVTAITGGVTARTVTLVESNVVIVSDHFGIHADGIEMVNSDVTVTAEIYGLQANGLLITESLLNVSIVEPAEEPVSTPIGVCAEDITVYEINTSISITVADTVDGKTLKYSTIYCEQKIGISAPAGASEQQMPMVEGDTCDWYEIVVINGDTVTYPKSVTISYIEDDDTPDELEDLVLIGSTVLTDGDYLDNNGSITTEKPEGGYAHLLDGVLTLHNFTHYGVGHLYATDYDDYEEMTYDYYAGIYSNNALTVRVEGKNLIDLVIFAGDRITDGIVVCNGDLTVEGDGTLEILTTGDGIFVQDGNLNVNGVTLKIDVKETGIYVEGKATAQNATVTIQTLEDDAIETHGDVTATDCHFEINAGDVGFDIYGNVLFENCNMIFNVLDDGIWVQKNTVLVDCTLEIVSEDSDAIRGYGDATIIGCTLDLNADSDGIDVDGGLWMDACNVVMKVNDTGIEVNGEPIGSLYLSNSTLNIVSEDSAILVSSNVEIMNCILSIEVTTIDSYDDISCISGGEVVISDSTVTLRAGLKSYLEETYLSGISSGNVEISNSSVTIAVLDGVETYSCYTYGVWGYDISVSDSVLTIKASGEALCVENVTMTNSKLDIWSEDDAFCADKVTLTDCEGSIISDWYLTFDVSGLSMENCSFVIRSNDDTPIVVGGTVEIIGGSLELYGYGLIDADSVTLSNCQMYLENWSSMSASISAYHVAIKGEETDIVHQNDNYEAPFIDAEDIQIASDLMIRDMENGSELTLDESGIVLDEFDNTVVNFQIVICDKDSDNTAESDATLIIGDKELGIGQFLDNEGNISDEMPAGGFAFFNGYELYLKSFSYEGIGTTLTNLNGVSITAGIYNTGDLTICLIGENSLAFTSENTVGITLGDGHLTIMGDGSLTLEATGKGIDLIGDLTVEHVTLNVSAFDTAIAANCVTLNVATVELIATGDENVYGIFANANLYVTESTLTVSVEGQTAEYTVYAILCQNNSVVVDSILTLTGGEGGFAAYKLALCDTNLTVTAAGEDAFGIALISLTVVDSTVSISLSGNNAYGINGYDITVESSTVNVTVTGTDAMGIFAVGLLKVSGKETLLTVAANGEANASIIGMLEIDDELAILAPEGATLVELEENIYTVVNADESYAMQVVIGAMKKNVEELTVTVGGVALSDGEYLDNSGNVSTEMPEGGYAYFKDGVLTLNGFTYLAKKYDSYDGIYSENDLTVNLIGENLICSYNQYGIYVDGELTVIGSGSLTVETNSTGVYAQNTLTVDCGGITVSAGKLAVEARDVNFLGGEARLSVYDGEKVLIAYKSITLSELLTVSSPEGAKLQRVDGIYVFTDAKDNALTALTVTWATHDCIDEDAVDHLCDICGKDYLICTDANTDHACDACGGEVGYHADTNSDHVCEYGCDVAIGTCEDADTDHDCDYGCDKVFGTCADADPKDHECDYGCDKGFGEHQAAENSHVCAYCLASVTDCSDANSDHACDVCGKELTHSHATAWKNNAVAHWHECACGDQTDLSAHTPGAAATETAAQTCTVCGYIITPALGHVTHTPKTEWASDGSYHWHECTDCGTQKIGQASHAYDHACDTDCNVCGKVRTVTHDYHTTWAEDANKHWHECGICGDKKDEATHTAGAAATETTAQTCTVCGYIITPATGHTTHTPRNEWSSNTTHHWHECTGCSDQEIDKTAHSYDDDCDIDCNVCGRVRIVTHNYQTEWSKDDNGHWHACSVCQSKTNEAEHSFGEWTVTKQPTSTEDGSRARSCICGATVTERIPATGESETTGENENTDQKDPAPTTPDDGEGLPTGAVVAIVIGSTAVAGVGGFAIWWFAISKRTLGQLGVACKGVGAKIGGACKGAFGKVKSVFTKK